MTIAVDVFVKDTSVSPQPIAAVVTNVYDAATLALIASGTTNSAGAAAFALPGSASPGTNYELRLYKTGVLFANPVFIAVIDPLTGNQTNVFDVSGTLLTLPIATDPRCCRCTGYIKDFGNRPVANALLRIMARTGLGMQSPKVVDSNLISIEVAQFHSDSNGKFSFDLLRKGNYYLSYAGEDDVTWNIVVPDQPAVNLIDLIHPQPVVLTWDQGVAPGNAVSVHIGQILQVPFSITFSDFEVVNTNVANWINLTNADGTIADLGLIGSTATAVLNGLAVGTTTVTVALQPNLLPQRVPDYSIVAPSLTVTVTL